MNVIGIIYDWYWLKFDVETTFLAHVALLKSQYHFDKEFGEKGLNVPSLLNEHKLDIRTFLFKLTM